MLLYDVVVNMLGQDVISGSSCVHSKEFVYMFLLWASLGITARWCNFADCSSWHTFAASDFPQPNDASPEQRHTLRQLTTGTLQSA